MKLVWCEDIQCHVLSSDESEFEIYQRLYTFDNKEIKKHRQEYAFIKKVFEKDEPISFILVEWFVKAEQLLRKFRQAQHT